MSADVPGRCSFEDDGNDSVGSDGVGRCPEVDGIIGIEVCWDDDDGERGGEFGTSFDIGENAGDGGVGIGTIS